jgi:hypothetical protein
MFGLCKTSPRVYLYIYIEVIVQRVTIETTVCFFLNNVQSIYIVFLCDTLNNKFRMFLFVPFRMCNFYMVIAATVDPWGGVVISISRVAAAIRLHVVYVHGGLRHRSVCVGEEKIWIFLALLRKITILEHLISNTLYCLRLCSNVTSSIQRYRKRHCLKKSWLMYEFQDLAQWLPTGSCFCEVVL